MSIGSIAISVEVVVGIITAAASILGSYFAVRARDKAERSKQAKEQIIGAIVSAHNLGHHESILIAHNADVETPLLLLPSQQHNQIVQAINEDRTELQTCLLYAGIGLSDKRIKPLLRRLDQLNNSMPTLPNIAVADDDDKGRAIEEYRQHIEDLKTAEADLLAYARHKFVERV